MLVTHSAYRMHSHLQRHAYSCREASPPKELLARDSAPICMSAQLLTSSSTMATFGCIPYAHMTLDMAPKSPATSLTVRALFGAMAHSPPPWP